MLKTDTKCWSCGQNTMISFEELGHGWQKCSSCGATNMPSPTTLRAKTVFVEVVTKGYPERKYRPREKRLAITQARAPSGKE